MVQAGSPSDARLKLYPQELFAKDNEDIRSVPFTADDRRGHYRTEAINKQSYFEKYGGYSVGVKVAEAALSQTHIGNIWSAFSSTPQGHALKYAWKAFAPAEWKDEDMTLGPLYLFNHMKLKGRQNVREVEHDLINMFNAEKGQMFPDSDDMYGYLKMLPRYMNTRL